MLQTIFANKDWNQGRPQLLYLKPTFRKSGKLEMSAYITPLTTRSPTCDHHKTRDALALPTSPVDRQSVKTRFAGAREASEQQQAVVPAHSSDRECRQSKFRREERLGPEFFPRAAGSHAGRAKGARLENGAPPEEAWTWDIG